jgi:hypothetical protein
MKPMNVARLRSPVYALCLSILAVAAACGTADVPPKPKATGTGTGGTADTTGAGGSSAGSSATGGTGGMASSAGGGAGTIFSGSGGSGGVGGAGVGGAGGSAVLEPATPLPLVVDTFYAASGYMGDGATPGAVVAGACTMRAPGNIGNCSKFTYTPIAASLMGWGGVYWQAPANNWGMMPGKHIEAGATKVTFYAAGAKGGEVVSFVVGGIGMGADPYQDPSKKELVNQVLTTTMTQYTIDLTGFTYVSIIGGFGWTIAATQVDAGAYDPTPVSIYIDGIQWVK